MSNKNKRKLDIVKNRLIESHFAIRLCDFKGKTYLIIIWSRFFLSTLCNDWRILELFYDFYEDKLIAQVQVQRVTRYVAFNTEHL